MSNFLLVEDVSVLAKSDTLDENLANIEGNKILVNSIKFHAVGDYITYSVKIKNNKNENYVLKSISDDNKNDYISYAYDNYKGIKLKANESFDFIFTETYSTEVKDIQKRQQNFSVNFYLVLEKENKDSLNSPDYEEGDAFEEKVIFSKNPIQRVIILDFILH